MKQQDLDRRDVRDNDGEQRRNAYSRPRITHESDLETRAGSPLGLPNPLDPAGIDPGTSGD